MGSKCKYHSGLFTLERGFTTFGSNICQDEDVKISYERQRGFNNSGCAVVLKDRRSARAALDKLQGAVLFGERMHVFPKGDRLITPSPKNLFLYLRMEPVK